MYFPTAMETTKLCPLGWNPFFEKQFDQYAFAGSCLGRVAVENKTNYELLTAGGEYVAEPVGRLLFSAASAADLPKVGDWVVFTEIAPGRAVVHAVLPRQSKLARKVPGKKLEEQVLATNLDVVFVVQGLDAQLNMARIERFLTIAGPGIQPVVVLNKCDVATRPTEALEAVRRAIPQVPVVAVSATGGDLAALHALLRPGVTFALVGPSGVGKSSLINALGGKAVLKTSPVREGDAKGRHTSTRRELVVLPNGAILIDTPGMRELQLWKEDTHLGHAFADVEALSTRCRFSDCTHQREKGCAILAALETGELSAAHYRSYQKLKRETEYLLSVEDGEARQSRKDKFKRSQKSYNQLIRRKER